LAERFNGKVFMSNIKIPPRDKDIFNLKLSIELVPKSIWYLNLRSLLDKSQWDKIRRYCYENASYVCEICGQVGDRWPVECHEKWEYNDKTYIAKLIGVIALCPNCHRAKHLGRTEFLHPEMVNNVYVHIRGVNNWDVDTLNQYIILKATEYEKRCQHMWSVDISWAIKLLENI
jgi:hypothetical protein